MESYSKKQLSLHYCAIVDAHGNEITITDSMIDHACKAFERQHGNPFANICDRVKSRSQKLKPSASSIGLAELA